MKSSQTAQRILANKHMKERKLQEADHADALYQLRCQYLLKLDRLRVESRMDTDQRKVLTTLYHEEAATLKQSQSEQRVRLEHRHKQEVSEPVEFIS